MSNKLEELIRKIAKILAISAVLILLSSAIAVAAPMQTVTGFIYPTGVAEPYSYAGWLAGGPEMPAYFPNFYHLGQDIEADSEDDVFPIADGEIVYVSTSGWNFNTGDNNFGLLVKHKLNTGEEFLALYGHVRPNNEDLMYSSSAPVNPPVEVDSGISFATVGPYGSVPHLHFGIHLGTGIPASPWGKMPIDQWPGTNGFVDPINWITSKKPFKSTIDSKLDLIFLVDTTGSMGPYINVAKASASAIVNALDLLGLDYRVAIADYRDYPELPYGGEMDYVYNLDLPFSNDRDTIISSINGLSIGWGADWRESVYSAYYLAMTDVNKDTTRADNYGWRKGAAKAIIQLADAPPHISEPWPGGHTLAEIISKSKEIDPVIAYIIVVGSDSTTYADLAEISEGTGGKIYTSPTADDVVDAIIEAIGDIEEPTTSYGVSVNITPESAEINTENTASYEANITNIGNTADEYDISLEPNNFGFQKGYPAAIQSSWINFNSAQITLDPGMSEARPFSITVPQNWAGMEDIIYTFNVIATSTTDANISNTSSAELKVKADKRSMAEYSKLEIQWLKGMIKDSEIKNALLAKLANAEAKVDQAIISTNNDKKFDSSLNTAQNVMNAFINQVEAQYDKHIMQPDAEMLKEKANQILQDLETAKNS